MKFLVSYKGINKILNDGGKYQDIVRFVHQNFFLKLSKWTMYYIDADGDSISLDGPTDVQVMIENQTGEQVKIYVKDFDFKDEHEDQYRIRIEEDVIFDHKSTNRELNTQGPFEERQMNFQVKQEEYSPEQKSKCDGSKFTKISNVSYTPLYIPIMPQGSQANQSIMAPVFVPIMTLLPSQSINQGQMTFVPVMTLSSNPNKHFEYPFPANINFPQFSQNVTQVQQCKQKQDKNCDQRLSITKKCYRLSKMYGGDMKDYQNFVQKNFDLKLSQLIELYLVEDENAKLSQEHRQEISTKAKKLAFYFNESIDKFSELVKRNPFASLKQLVKMAKSENKQKRGEIADCKMEKKIEGKAKEQVNMQQPKVGSSPKLPSFLKPVHTMTAQRRNELLLNMKNSFGQQNMHKFLHVINQNGGKSNQEIIKIYMDKQN